MHKYADLSGKSDRMNGNWDTDRCTDISSEPDRMSGNRDTDRCTDVSSEGAGQNEWEIGTQTDVQMLVARWTE